MINLRYRLARWVTHLSNAIGNVANWLDNRALEDIYNEHVQREETHG